MTGTSHVTARPDACASNAPSGTQHESHAHEHANAQYIDHALLGSRNSADDDTSTTISDHQWAVLVERMTVAVAAEEHENSRLNDGQRGRSWSLGKPRDPSRPVWTSRPKWREQVREKIASGAGIKSCSTHRVAAASVQKCADVLAEYADSKTGGGITASAERLARQASVSVSVLRRARRVLRDLTLAYETARGRTLTTAEYRAALAHHGMHQHRAASTWALTSSRDASRRPAQHTPARSKPAAPRRPVHGDHLSLRALGTRALSVSSNSPNARKRARGTNFKSQPHPLHMQRAAAILALKVPVLAMNSPGDRHIGALVAVLHRCGIDTRRWSGELIARRISEDNRARGWTMPTEAVSPLGWLRYRLRQLDWNIATPAETADQQAKEIQEVARRRMSEAAAARACASPAHSLARRHAVANWRSYTPSQITEPESAPPQHHDQKEKATMTVTVYTKPACVQCAATHRALDQHRVEYESVDLTKDAGALERMRELGYAQAPVVVVDAKIHWSGYRPDRIGELRDLAEARK